MPILIPNETPELVQKNINLAFDSVTQLVDQCYQAWQESRVVMYSDKYLKIENIIFCGMGGSSLPAHITSSIFSLKVSFYICEGYILPEWANKNTLVVLGSYSGDTEETLSCAKQAEEKKCLITGLTTGGKLQEFFETKKHPYYHIDPQYNPSRSQRFGIGYGIFGQLGILSSLKLINHFSDEELDNQLAESIKYLTLHIDLINKSAQDLVLGLKGDTYVIISSEHLIGNAHTFTIQINETSKTLAFSIELPEANHNMIEGYRKLQPEIALIFVESPDYTNRVIERFDITREILSQTGYKNFTYSVNKGSYMQQMLELLLFSSFFSVMLAQSKNQDPLDISWVTHIKGKLAQSTK